MPPADRAFDCHSQLQIVGKRALVSLFFSTSRLITKHLREDLTMAVSRALYPAVLLLALAGTVSSTPEIPTEFFEAQHLAGAETRFASRRVHYEQIFRSWMAEHGMTFGTKGEFERRLRIFAANRYCSAATPSWEWGLRSCLERSSGVSVFGHASNLFEVGMCRCSSEEAVDKTAVDHDYPNGWQGTWDHTARDFVFCWMFPRPPLAVWLGLGSLFGFPLFIQVSRTVLPVCPLLFSAFAPGRAHQAIHGRGCVLFYVG